MLTRERESTIKAIEELSRDYILSLRNISKSENPAKSAYLAAYYLVSSISVFVGGDEGKECETDNLRPDGFIDNLSKLSKTRIKRGRKLWFSKWRNGCLIAHEMLNSNYSLLDAVSSSGLTSEKACRCRSWWSKNQVKDKGIQDLVVQSRLMGNRDAQIASDLSLNLIVVGDILYIERFADIVKEVIRDGRQGESQSLRS